MQFITTCLGLPKIKDKSDIDIAIVSEPLFNYVQENIYDWSRGFLENWNRNSYYDNGKKKFGVSLKYKFLEYLGKGWYRPDFAPAGYSITTQHSDIKDVINGWSKQLDRKVAYAIYKNWGFFKKYQTENIIVLKNKIESGELL